MATAYFHYTRNYFVSRTLILWTAEHMINHSELIRKMVKTSSHMKMAMKHSTLYPFC